MVDRNVLPLHRDRLVVSGMGLGAFGPPGYEYSSVESRDGVTVLVEVREFVAGVSLAEAAPYMTVADMCGIEDEMRSALQVHGGIVSQTHGILGDRHCEPFTVIS